MDGVRAFQPVTHQFVLHVLNTLVDELGHLFQLLALLRIKRRHISHGIGSHNPGAAVGELGVALGNHGVGLGSMAVMQVSADLFFGQAILLHHLNLLFQLIFQVVLSPLGGAPVVQGFLQVGIPLGGDVFA